MGFGKAHYRLMEQDVFGWVRHKAKPIPYDLVQLEFDNGRDGVGWWTGDDWYSRYLTENSKVVAWRRRIHN